MSTIHRIFPMFRPPSVSELRARSLVEAEYSLEIEAQNLENTVLRMVALRLRIARLTGKQP